MKLLKTYIFYFIFFAPVVLFAQQTEILPEGVVFSKMSEVERDALSPSEAQTIYNTDTGELNTFDGVEWVTVGGAKWSENANGIYFSETDKNVGIGAGASSSHRLYVAGDAYIADSLRAAGGRVLSHYDYEGTFNNNSSSGNLELLDREYSFGFGGSINNITKKIELKARGHIISDLQPEMTMYNTEEEETFVIDHNSVGAPNVELNSELGNRRIYLNAQSDAVGSSMDFYNMNNKRTIYINTNGSADEPYIAFYDNNGATKSIWDSDVSGDSRMTVDEVSITGGSDFAENFDIHDADNTEIQAGMLVSINPNSDGQLNICSKPYDHKLVGIISGAQGVEPGMMMGQKGSIADGAYPIALVGRVYVLIDESKGSIQPGDLLTSSDKAGYAMKVKRFKKAKGAIIGKALTATNEDGYALVLVNLQ